MLEKDRGEEERKAKRGFVIAFHSKEYLGLTCRERGIKFFKPKLRRRVDFSIQEDLEQIKEDSSIEEGIYKRDRVILDFIVRKIKKDEPIFLDYKISDVKLHNESEDVLLFRIASIAVTEVSFNHMNNEDFLPEEQKDIDELVFISQYGKLRSGLGLSELSHSFSHRRRK